jgi:primosomal protein N' (replication factor Y) (superfamily II helicase)
MSPINSAVSIFSQVCHPHIDAPLLWLNVAVNLPLQALPADTALSDGVDYVWRRDSAAAANAPYYPPTLGSIVVVRWAGRRCLGVVIEILPQPRYDPAKILPATLLPALAAYVLPTTVLKLAQFASQYYHRALGEVLLPTVSAALPAPQRPKPIPAKMALSTDSESALPKLKHTLQVPPATVEQRRVLSDLDDTGFGVHLLYGVTGSGKTEVYLARAAQAIQQGKQVLLLVPEIVLTPALLARVKKALPHAKSALLHSDIAVSQRRKTWAACLAGEIDVLVGTRLAVFAPLPRVGLIVVDEEHDPSYKQQEGVRYCARNLATVRAHLEDCPIILGSATPSLESWLKARDGKYRSHRMLSRAKTSALPTWKTIDLLQNPTKTGLSLPIMTALSDALERGEQSLVFLNRRGFAPVLTCTGCGWASECTACSSHMALHRLRQAWTLVCHHCAAKSLPPKACPKCGNAQLEPEGQGTQAIEDTLRQHFPKARLARLDSDITRQAGQGKRIADAMKARELDILVGTQMTAKGHDFPALSTVVVVGCDGILASPDYRGVERLFALLTQVAGRAGRADIAGTVWLQTRQASHAVFTALLHPSVDVFYEALLDERKQAGLPPYGYQAVLRASHADLEVALAWLAKAKQTVTWIDVAKVRIFSPVPMLMPKVAAKFRAQMLFESASRTELHSVLRDAVPMWVAASKALRAGDLGYGVVWHLEVDPSDV